LVRKIKRRCFLQILAQQCQGKIFPAMVAQATHQEEAMEALIKSTTQACHL
jgi:hypothetical protein